LNLHSDFILSYLGEVPKAEGAGIFILLQIMDIPIQFNRQRVLVTKKVNDKSCNTCASTQVQV